VLADLRKLPLPLAAAALLGGSFGGTSHATLAPVETVTADTSGAAPIAEATSCLAKTICSVK